MWIWWVMIAVINIFFHLCGDVIILHFCQYWFTKMRWINKNGNSPKIIIASPKQPRYQGLSNYSPHLEICCMETTIYPERVNKASDGMINHGASHHRTPSRPPSTLRTLRLFMSQDMNPGDFADAGQLNGDWISSAKLWTVVAVS